MRNIQHLRSFSINFSDNQSYDSALFALSKSNKLLIK